MGVVVLYDFLSFLTDFVFLGGVSGAPGATCWKRKSVGWGAGDVNVRRPRHVEHTCAILVGVGALKVHALNNIVRFGVPGPWPKNVRALHKIHITSQN